MTPEDLMELAELDDDWESSPTNRLVSGELEGLDAVRGLYDFDDDEPTETMGR